MATNILGISALFHDSAAALVRDGEIVAAVQEERFSRRKHDADLPRRAMAHCLAAGGVAPGELAHVVYFEKPVSAFARHMNTIVDTAPRGFGQLRRSAAQWLKRKLWVGYEIERALAELGHRLDSPVLYTEHHQAHAAGAFFPSPFESAAVITLDGVGEWATTSVGHGVGNHIEPGLEIHFPHSLGLVYSVVTQMCGFRVNSGEYKLMGLAPYGEPTYRDRMLDQLIDLRTDGSYHVNTDLVGYLTGERMTNRRIERLFDGPAREPDAPLTQREADLARSIQAVTEEAVLGIGRRAAELTGERRACLSGGVALNAVANGRLLRDGPFDEIWVQPASGDAGSAIGAALHVWHEIEMGPRSADGVHDAMKGCLLGPTYGSDEIEAALAEQGVTAERLPPAERAERIAALLADGATVAVFDGPMEFGPRALGNRSILADPRSADAQTVVNGSIKKREGFRPFAPAVLEERAAEWFELDGPLPYMTVVVPVRTERRTPVTDPVAWPPEERVREVRSSIPAVTHVDHSARVQTVSRARSPRFHAILEAFERRTGCPVLLNTSLNVRGEPIVCTPHDALAMFADTALDHLALGDHLVARSTRPADDVLASSAASA